MRQRTEDRYPGTFRTWRKLLLKSSNVEAEAINKPLLLSPESPMQSTMQYYSRSPQFSEERCFIGKFPDDGRLSF
jgi:hypothetical protein